MPNFSEVAPSPISRTTLLDLEGALNEEPGHDNILRIKKCIDQYRFQLDLLKTSIRTPQPGSARMTAIQKWEMIRETHDQIVTIQAKRETLEGILKLKDRPELFKVAMRSVTQGPSRC
jgi:hypothetical protein